MTASPPAATLDKVPRPLRSVGFGLASLVTLYTLTARQHMHGRRWLILGLVCLTPALLGGVVRATDATVSAIFLEFLLVFMFIPQALLPLVALLYGSGIIQDELEEQTFTYLLMRPIPRWVIYCVKIAATLTTVVVLTAAFTTLTYAVIYIGADAQGANVPVRCLKAVGIHCLAVCTYCCLFALISLLTRWALLLGFLYAALVEGLLANLPFAIRLLTVIFHARIIAYRSMSFLEKSGSETENLADEAWNLGALTDPRLADQPSLAFSLTVLLLACFFFTLLGAYLCSQREFHVKTPEGT